MTFQPIMGQSSSFGLPSRDRGAKPCKRSCCWTPLGHSGAAVNCQCHPAEKKVRS